MADQPPSSSSMAEMFIARDKIRASKVMSAPPPLVLDHTLPSLEQLHDKMGNAFPGKVEFDSFHFPRITTTKGSIDIGFL